MILARKTKDIPDKDHYAILVEESCSYEIYETTATTEYLEYYYTFNKEEWTQEIIKRTTDQSAWKKKFKAIVVKNVKVQMNINIKE